MAKKKKRGDFQKVKLKLGRRLKKGLNVTDTTFKTKRVIFTEQFHCNDASLPILQEQLSRLKHCNPSSRKDALFNIKKLLADNLEQQKDLIFTYLPSFFKKIGECIVDIDGYVRKTALSVLTKLLHCVNSLQLNSIFPILSSYVSCAATHIREDIRRDSLEFLNLIIDIFPASLYFTNEFLHVFLELISFQKTKKNINSSRRTLNTTPDENIASQEWRVQVYDCMAKFLKGGIAHLISEKKIDREVDKINLTEDKDVCIPIFLYSGLKPLKPKQFSFYNQTECSTNRKSDSIFQFVSDVMSLLFETWMESSPQYFLSCDSANKLSLEAVTAMASVIQVTCCIAKWMELIPNRIQGYAASEWFKERYILNIEAHYLSCFPISSNGRANKQKALCSKMNLQISELFAVISDGRKYNTSVSEKVLKYLMHTIKYKNFDNCDIETLLRIVRRFLSYSDFEEFGLTLLELLFEIYQQLPSEHKIYGQLKDFLTDVVSDLKFRNNSRISCEMKQMIV